MQWSDTERRLVDFLRQQGCTVEYVGGAPHVVAEVFNADDRLVEQIFVVDIEALARGLQ